MKGNFNIMLMILAHILKVFGKQAKRSMNRMPKKKKKAKMKHSCLQNIFGNKVNINMLVFKTLSLTLEYHNAARDKWKGESSFHIGLSIIQSTEKHNTINIFPSYNIS